MVVSLLNEGKAARTVVATPEDVNAADKVSAWEGDDVGCRIPTMWIIVGCAAVKWGC